MKFKNLIIKTCDRFEYLNIDSLEEIFNEMSEIYQKYEPIITLNVIISQFLLLINCIKELFKYIYINSNHLNDSKTKQ